ncbi:hypothetical protein TraAM80_09788, partial [Trypanosoma rangeli]
VSARRGVFNKMGKLSLTSCRGGNYLRAARCECANQHTWRVCDAVAPPGAAQRKEEENIARFFWAGRCVTAGWRHRMEAYMPCVVVEAVSCFFLSLAEVLHFHEHRGAAGRRAIAAGLLVAVVSLRELVFVAAE